ncbi:MAG: hypothetical protein HY885_06475 [Deltaproteobacteria bacterium]|nr:hypothetical protein [Deltaproteobacteria bacterium]
MTIDSKKKRQYILIAVAVILFIGVIIRYFTALPGLSDGSGDISLKEKKIAKLQERVENKENLQKQLIRLSKEVAQAENGLLNGKTPPLAAVDLQNRLTDIAVKAGAVISSQRVLTPATPKENEDLPYLEIPVQISMTLSMRQLQEMLYNIAAAPVFLQVTDATVKIKNKTEGALQADLTVAGMMHNTGARQEGNK